jgi:hypothetical protein
MLTPKKYRFSTDEEDTGQRWLFPASYGLLFFIWAIGLFMLVGPFSTTIDTGQKILIFFIPVLLSLALIWLDVKNGIVFWFFGLTALVTQTGFQADVRNIRTSILEIVIIILVLMIVIQRSRNIMNLWAQFPGRSLLISFSLYAMAIFFLGMLRGDSFSMAIVQLKGFILYPFLGVLIYFGGRSKTLIRYVLFGLIVWYMLVAGWGIAQFFQGQQVLTQEIVVYRSSGEYAPINIYGITLMACALLVIGVATSVVSSKWRFVAFGFAVILIVGMLVSVSRAALAGLVIGLLFLILLNPNLKTVIFSILIGLALFWVLNYFLPYQVSDRLFQTTDSSTVKREFYLESGLQALKVYWAIGVGWGNGYFYQRDAGLYPSGFMPWYHNDYLNLAVQVGLFGLALYVSFWGSVIKQGWKFIRSYKDSWSIPYVKGTLSALIGLLMAALFEHVLWRPDMAGLVGWLLGMLVASMYLGQQDEGAKVNID